MAESMMALRRSKMWSRSAPLCSPAPPPPTLPGWPLLIRRTSWIRTLWDFCACTDGTHTCVTMLHLLHKEQRLLARKNRYILRLEIVHEYIISLYLFQGNLFGKVGVDSEDCVEFERRVMQLLLLCCHGNWSRHVWCGRGEGRGYEHTLALGRES